MTKQTFKRIASLLGVLMILYVGIALISESVPLFGRYQHYVVVSDSMEPTLDVHDVTIVDRRLDFKEDDIIAFKTVVNNQEVRLIHYLDAIEDHNDSVEYYTRPENGIQDDWVLSEEDILGRHVLTIPRIGQYLIFLSSTIGRVVLVANIIGIVIIVKLFKTKQE